MDTDSRKQKSGESSRNKDQDTTDMRQQKGKLGEKEEKKNTVQYKTVDWEYCQQRPKRVRKKLEYDMEYDTKIHTGGLIPDETCINWGTKVNKKKNRREIEQSTEEGEILKFVRLSKGGDDEI